MATRIPPNADRCEHDALVRKWFKGQDGKFTLYYIGEALQCAEAAANCYERMQNEQELCEELKAQGKTLWEKAVAIFTNAKQKNIVDKIYHKLWKMHRKPCEDCYGERTFKELKNPAENALVIREVIKDKKSFALVQAMYEEKKSTKTEKTTHFFSVDVLDSLELARCWFKTRDVVIDKNGKTSFESIEHVQTWFINKHRIALYYIGGAFNLLKSALIQFQAAEEGIERGDWEKVNTLSHKGKEAFKQAMALFGRMPQHKDIERDIYCKLWEVHGRKGPWGYGEYAFFDQNECYSTPNEKIGCIDAILEKNFGKDRKPFELLIDDRRYALDPQGDNNATFVEQVQALGIQKIYGSIEHLLSKTKQNPSLKHFMQWNTGTRIFTLYDLSGAFSQLNLAIHYFYQEKSKDGKESWKKGADILNQAGYQEFRTRVHHKIWKMHGKPEQHGYGTNLYECAGRPPEGKRNLGDAILKVMRKTLSQEPYGLVIRNQQNGEIETLLYGNKQSFSWSFLDPIYDDSGFRHFNNCSSFTHVNYYDQIRLVRNEQDPHTFKWRIYDHKSSTVRWENACLNQDTLDHAKSNRSDIDPDFEVHVDLKNMKNSGLRLKKIPSQIAPNFLVSRDQYAVTLASIDTSTGSTSSYTAEYGHAVIYYEGIEKGRQFAQRLHLTEHKGIKHDSIGLLDSKRIRTSITWVVDASPVKRMVNNALTMTKTFNFTKYNCGNFAVDCLNTLGLNLPEKNVSKSWILKTKEKARELVGINGILPTEYIESLRQADESRKKTDTCISEFVLT